VKRFIIFPPLFLNYGFPGGIYQENQAADDNSGWQIRTLKYAIPIQTGSGNPKRKNECSSSIK
jgi:hypothetical protein